MKDMGVASNDLVSVIGPSNAVGQAFERPHRDRLEQMKPDALRRIHQTKVLRYLRIRSLDQRDELLPLFDPEDLPHVIQAFTQSIASGSPLKLTVPEVLDVFREHPNASVPTSMWEKISVGYRQ